MPSKIIALIGSGEFTTTLEETDKYLASLVKNPNVAIFPTAAGQERDFSKWIDQGINHFSKLEIPATGFEVVNMKQASDPKLKEQLKPFNIFYFSGGDPGYLLDIIKNSLLLEIVLERVGNGAILAGSSAGAMVMGKKVMGKVYQFMERGVPPPWEEGLDIVGFGIVPHFDFLQKRYSKKFWDKFVANLPTDTKIIGIDENTALILEGKRKKVIGNGKVHKLN